MPPPTKYKNWYLFPHKIFNALESVDCNDTITGVCQETSSLKECISACEKDKGCKSGYFIETPDHKNICVPLYDYINNPDEAVVPYYRIRDKDIYPVLKNMDSTVFVSDHFAFPPNLPNAVFYGDNFVLRNVNTKLALSIDNDGTVAEDAIFTKTQPINLQFLPAVLRNTSLQHYIQVRHGDEAVINIPQTSFVLRKRPSTSELGWLLRANDADVSSNKIQIFGYRDKIKVGDPLSYEDDIYLAYQNQPIVLDPELGFLSVENSSVENALVEAKNSNILFQLEPKVQVYYCSLRGCEKVELDKTERNEFSATYKNTPVSRSPECWSMCPAIRTGVSEASSPHKFPWVTVILLICGFLLFFTAVLFLLKMIKKMEIRKIESNGQHIY